MAFPSRNSFARHFTTPFLLSVSKLLSDHGKTRSTYSFQNIALSSAPETSRPSWSTASLAIGPNRSEEHTSELQSLRHLACRLLLEKTTHLVLTPSSPSPSKQSSRPILRHDPT